jgi:hypothetical protein
MTCECKKVIGTLEQERGELATAYNLMHSALIKEKDARRSLETERDQLAARVERLEAPAVTAANELSELIEDIQSEWGEKSCKRAVETLKQLRGMLNESPAASLLLHDAGVLRKWAARFGHEAYPNYENKYSMGHYAALTNVSRMLHEEANQIEQESKS